MEIAFLAGVAEELQALPRDERRAMARAFEKLREIGDQLPYPQPVRCEEAGSVSCARALVGRPGERCTDGLATSW
jgi:hypothetical protein